MKRRLDSASSQQQQQLMSERRQLPIWKHRRRLLQLLSEHDTVVLISSTGSGKTTQIPQFLLSSDAACRIAVTQPRRVAAISIAQRVAAEMGCAVGDAVGYKVRFEDACGPATRLKYLTDGCLVREAMSDRLLSAYSLLVVDEAHERTLQTDLLFGMVVAARRARQQSGHAPLRLLVMSATIDPSDFEAFLGAGTRLVYVEGRRHALEVRAVTRPVADHVQAAVGVCQRLHREEKTGDILCFLAGREEIERAVRATVQALAVAAESEEGVGKALVQPLYAGLPAAMQMKALAAAPEGTRKILFATNVAETSITIPGVRVVVDSGFCKIKSCHPATGMETLLLARVSQAQAWQRAGRAAREGPGLCLRLFTDAEYAGLARQQQPEVMRVGLAAACLQILRLGEQPARFPFLSSPPADSVSRAVELLRQLGAVERGHEEDALTELGRRMIRFPLHPALSRSILAASALGCAVEVLSVVAMLSVDHLFFLPRGRPLDEEAPRSRFHSPLGDFLSLLRVYREYKTQLRSRTAARWCRRHCLNQRALKFAVRVRRQLREVCLDLRLPVASCGEQRASVNRAFLAGLFPNTARLVRRGKPGLGLNCGPDRDYRSLSHGATLRVHPESALFDAAQPVCVMFAECLTTNRAYMRHVAPVNEEWLREVAPHLLGEEK